MEANHIIVRFGELTTKGKNRKLFTRKLLKNTKEILHDFTLLSYELTYDHIFSLCYKVEHDLQKVKEAACKIVDEAEGTTFKINTKRSDKEFPMTSPEMNRAIAGYIFNMTERRLI